MTVKPRAHKCYRAWEYSTRGDYHRNLDMNWSYTPTYLRKMKEVSRFIDRFPLNTPILDAGCGEGVLVDEYRSKGRPIQGLDLNYSSSLVEQGDILSMPYETGRFEVVFLLDVFEHLSYSDQPKALKEIRRVLRPNGSLFLSVPNMAHLNARFLLLFRGRFDRTDVELNHPGERPLGENLRLLVDSGFEVVELKGITLTVPFLYRGLICRHAKKFRWLHDLLNGIVVPSLAMINIIICESKA